jgi:Cys-tRNA(Pro)/Cys-tRNA(Cys) deacylase
MAQIAWPALRHYLGRSRVSMASPQEVLAASGYRTGAVSPFGLRQPMRILVDRRVLDEREISIGSVERGVTVILRTDDLQRALGEFETGDFCPECDQ